MKYTIFSQFISNLSYNSLIIPFGVEFILLNVLFFFLGGGGGGHGIGGIGAVVSRVPELKNDQSLKISLKSVDDQDTTIISRVPSLLLFSLSPCLFFFFLFLLFLGSGFVTRIWF